MIVQWLLAMVAMHPGGSPTTKPPSITEVRPPARHQTPGDVEINSSHRVEFPRQYPNFLDRGVYHHGHHHH